MSRFLRFLRGPYVLTPFGSSQMWGGVHLEITSEGEWWIDAGVFRGWVRWLLIRGVYR